MLTKQALGVETRDRLLDAAVETMRLRGPAGFTLDAVAAGARVSKGALLHHFPSKDALIEALLRRLLNEFEARVDRLLEREPPGAGRRLRAYVRASFEENPIPLELAAVLAASLSENDPLLRLLREDTARWRDRLAEDGVPAARAEVVRLAADASWTDRLLATGGEGEPTRAGVLAELLALTTPEER